MTPVHTDHPDVRIERSLVRGWELITLTSADVALQVVPGLGGSVVSLRRLEPSAETPDGTSGTEPADTELLYRTPWGLPNAATGALPGAAIELRHDFNPGGWQSLFPNAGDNAIVDGTEWGTDGEARLAPFDAVTETEEDFARVTMTTRLRRTPFELTKIITVRGSEVRLAERIRHRGRNPIRTIWANQLALGAPLIGAATEIDCGASIVHPDAGLLYDVDYADVSPWPRTFGPDSMINLRYLPEPGSEANRMAYLSEFASGWATVTNPEIDCRLRLDWDLAAWPHLWYELEDGGTADYPWHGGEHFLALSPSSSWPARGVHDARRISDSALTLEPDEERSAELTLRLERLSARS